MLDDILLQVNKPARYIGEEWNVCRKDFDKAEIKFALCFPNLYELGMSNLGLRIIYGILNELADVVCERFFSPGIDMEKILRDRDVEIFSLESKKKLREFDLIGFSLAYELDYINVLNILDLGSVPLRASLRGPDYPLVIGGGPCVLNPEPLHEFFDLFVIGEAEEVILEIVALYRRFKKQFKASSINKPDLLTMMSLIEGVYVPSLYDVFYRPDGKIEDFRARIKGIPVKIKKRIVGDLNNSYFPSDWLIPYISIVHDRVILEIMRGCPNRCRFCQARSQYFPFRQRGVKNILNLAYDTYKRTGYEELSLAGLSLSDYSDIEKLIKQLVDLFKKDGVSISLPSIKPNTRVRGLTAQLVTIKKTGLTFAPEAATEKLRQIIGKDFNLQDFFKTIEQAYRNGWQHIKLYFMIGLPSEEQLDLDGIIDFAQEASQLRRKITQRPAQVNISINALVPKPHTPFQWLKMEDWQNIKYKQDYLKKRLRNKRLKLDFHNHYLSFLEGVLSRGDRRLSRVIISAFNKGIRLKPWDNDFVFDRWQDVFRELNIDPNFYLRERQDDEYLPWDFLDVGMSKKVLLAEFNKIVAETQNKLYT